MSEHGLKTPIAITGMSCRLPGGRSVDEFWKFLKSGGSGITELPDSRLNRSLYFHPKRGKRAKTYTTLGGIVAQPAVKEPSLLQFSHEFSDADPCHRALCEVAVEAWKDAGFQVETESGRRVGVFVGHSGGSALGTELAASTQAEEAFDFLRDVREFSELPDAVQSDVLRRACEQFRKTRPMRKSGGGPELTADRAAGLISNVLKLDGPAMSIDAACASSLVALALGILAVESGQIETAIIGGASWAKADSLLLFSQAQSASALGSRPFDAAADGLVGSEGYVVLVIKPLCRALEQNDRIHAVIRGLGISSDGCGRSLWAPRKEGQCAAMQRAYSADVQPDSIEYIEAHATSTQVGDATEMEALEEFFGDRVKKLSIPIGSVKSNIGHSLETAGLASLLKVVLSLKNDLIPATINLQNLNPSIPWERLPFYVPTTAVVWPKHADGTSRRAGINAFGIGGLNVHVVLEEWLNSVEASAVGDVAGRRTTSGTSNSSSLRTPPPTLSSPRSVNEAVAVIGRGIILPGARSLDALRHLLKSKQRLLIDAPADRWRERIGVASGPIRPHQTPTTRGGYVVDYQYDWKQYRIPPKQIQRANPLQFMLLDAATQALTEAGYDRRAFDRDHTAVVIGSAFGTEFSNQLAVGLRLPEFRAALTASLSEHGLSTAACEELLEKYEQRLLDAKPALVDETGSFTTSTLASRIAKTLNLMGGECFGHK